MRDTLTPLLSADESGSTGRLRRALFAGTFAALVVLALVVPPAAVGDGAAADDWPWDVQPGEDSDLFPLVGELTFHDDEGEEITPALVGIDPGAHLAVFYHSKGANQLRLVDTRTLEHLDVIELPASFGLGSSVIDTENHRLFAPLAIGVSGPAPGEEELPEEHRYCDEPDSDTDLTLKNKGKAVTYGLCDDVLRAPRPAIMTVSLTGEHPPVVTPIELDLPPEASALKTDVATKLAYHGPTDNVYAVTESKGGGSAEASANIENYTTLHEIRAADLVASDADGAEAVWSYPLDDCDYVGNKQGGFVARSLRDDFVYLPCEARSVGGEAKTGMHGALRVDLNAGSDPSDTSQFETRFHPFAADLSNGATVGDPVNDLLLLVQGSSGFKRLFTFDANREAWTGASAVTEAGNAAMPVTNRATGRIYQWNVGGGSVWWHGNFVPFMVTEGDRVEVPNGDTYDLGLWRAGLTGGFDPSTRRLFLPNTQMCLRWADEGGCAEPEEDFPHVRVFEDRLPEAPPPEPADYDQNTEDVTDGPVYTQSGAIGTAFGARYLWAGGLQSSTGRTGTLRNEGGSRGDLRQAPVGPANRDVLRAHVREASLSRVTGTPNVVASASGLTLGEQTGSDLKGNTAVRCATTRVAGDCLPNDWQNEEPKEVERELYRSFNGRDWPDDFPEEMRGHEAYCDDFGGEPNGDATSGAAVSCDTVEPVGQAGALYTATDEQAPVQVGYAETSVEVREDEESGAVATATAVARDVDLFGQISIGEIRTVATAVAHGRPGTAATELVREYRQVRVGDGFACGWGDDDPCDVWEVVREINAVMQPRVVASVPGQDTTLNPDASDEPDDQPGEARVSNATPGGARAIVTLNPYDARSNETVNQDQRTELPGLQIVYYDDHEEASRHIFQFAAVNLDTFFYISSAPTFDPPDWANGGGGFGDGSGSGGGLPGGLGGVSVRGVTPPPVVALGEGPVAPAEELGSSEPVAPTADVGEFEVDGGTSGLEQGRAPSLGTAEGPALDAGQGGPVPEVASDASGGQPVAQGGQAGSSGPGGLMLTRQRMGETVPLAVLWVLAALPFYLAVRRRRLLTSSAR